MKDCSKIRWIVLIPVFGVIIVNAIVFFGKQTTAKRYRNLFLWMGLSCVIGVLLFGVSYAIVMAVSESISIEIMLALVSIIFLAMHIGVFIWCSVTARKIKAEKQSTQNISKT